MGFVITGRITESESGTGVPNLRVEAWDKDLFFDDKLGECHTSLEGHFQIEYTEENFRDLFEQAPDIFLRVFASNDEELHSTERSVRCESGREEHFNINIPREVLGENSPKEKAMATKEYWFTIENHAWDMNPNNFNRMTGETIADMGHTPVTKTLHSPITGVTRTVTMYDPVEDEALILRRYTENWGAPDDRRVNPWDLNEPDPTDNGTMGTIPGPTIECNIGDNVVVHFKNLDSRLLPALERTHSLHPHGIVFAPEHDGAYPLSPQDLAQPVGGESALWATPGLDVDGFKKGDRVPPGATFTYRWDTFRWPSTAGVWMFHDHAICDHHNVILGAIAFLVIHNPADGDDVLAYDDSENQELAQDLPPGGPNGRLTKWCLLKFAAQDFVVRSYNLRALSPSLQEEIKGDFDLAVPSERGRRSRARAAPQLAIEQVFEFENNIVEIEPASLAITAFLRRCYVQPPRRALYLQLYHEMHSGHGGNQMAINGRTWMGNTPTLIGGLDTKMRFGFVAMNNLTFHTFHLHGHRWVVPGPTGGNVGGDVPPPGTGVQVSPLNQGTSQFEDTRIFGPANSFSFTINEGSFMGPPLGGGAKGEWHMHCHVLGHMMGGMMGSLLIVESGDTVTALPHGIRCPTDELGEGEVIDTVVIDGFAFTPPSIIVPPGTVVTFDFVEAQHTVITVSTTGAAVGIEINNGGGPADAVPAGDLRTVTISGNPGDQINYQCGIHGAGMSGTIIIS